MTYAQRDDLVEGKSTEANYDRWHEALDDVKLVEDFHPAEARTIDEILGEADGDE